VNPNPNLAFVSFAFAETKNSVRAVRPGSIGRKSTKSGSVRGNVASDSSPAISARLLNGRTWVPDIDPVFESLVREIQIKIGNMLHTLREEERERFRGIAKKNLRGESLKKILREIGEPDGRNVL